MLHLQASDFSILQPKRTGTIHKALTLVPDQCDVGACQQWQVPSGWPPPGIPLLDI